MDQAFSPSSPREGDLFPDPCEGLTLVMACRSFHRADTARRELYASLDSHMAKKNTGYGGHAKRFRENLKIEIHTVDLAEISSIFAFADEVSKTYVERWFHFAHLTLPGTHISRISFSMQGWPVMTTLIGGRSSNNSSWTPWAW